MQVKTVVRIQQPVQQPARQATKQMVTLKVYPLPTDVPIAEEDIDDACPNCDEGLSFKYNAIRPIITVDGFYMGEYSFQGFVYCKHCGYFEGDSTIPETVVAKVRPTGGV